MMLRKVSAWIVLLISFAVVAPALAAPPAVVGDEAHSDFLSWEVGDWDARITLPDLSGGPAQQFAGEQEDRVSGCGQWLVTDLRMVATRPGEEPPPYEGHGLLGFDPAKGKLVGVWVDSKTNWLATAEGKVSGDGKQLQLDVQGRNPLTGEPMVQHFVTTRIDENTRRLEIFVPAPDGSRIKAATIDYSRR